jgi:drug/metabolite transporter superfamily protein YnfA
MHSAFNIVMRIISSLIGLAMALMGGVWILQGLNLAWGPMRQSFMENDKHWAVYGAILAVIGVCQVIWSNTRQAKA